MKTTVSKYEFIDAFVRLRPTNFTPEALGEMFDYLEQYEQDVGEEIGMRSLPA